MQSLHLITTRLLVGWMLQQMTLQQELLETQKQLVAAQKQVIALQKKIDRMTPKNAPDEELIWHIAAGMFSQEAAQSEDIEVVRHFLNWINTFGKKHIKPYVNPKAYMECMNQMTRGLTEWISELERREKLVQLERHTARLREEQQLARRN